MFPSAVLPSRRTTRPRRIGLTSAIFVVLSVGCGSLLRSAPPAAPEEQPLTQVEEDDEDTDEPRKPKAPPPQYGKRVVRDGSGTQEPKPTKPKAPAAQQSH